MTVYIDALLRKMKRKKPPPPPAPPKTNKRQGDADIVCEECKDILNEAEVAYLVGVAKIGLAPRFVHYCKQCFHNVAGQEYIEGVENRGRVSPLAKRRS
jgi:hypothetical protein